MKSTRYQEIRIRHQIAPLIDVVFLLLIYFMVTAAILKKEGDISFQLPLPGDPLQTMPVEAYIQIEEDGVVVLEGMRFNSEDRDLPGLVSHMSMLRQMADAQRSLFVVTLAPDSETLHRRVIEVIDACKDARIRHLAFADSTT